MRRAAQAAAGFVRRPLGREEEIIQIALDMLLHASDFHPLAARGDGIRYGLFEVKLGAELIEIRDMEIRAEADRALIRLEFSEEHLDECALSRPVRSDQAEAVTAHQREVQVPDHGLFAERF